MNETSFSIDSSEGPYNTGKKYENGNLGHRPGVKEVIFLFRLLIAHKT